VQCESSSIFLKSFYVATIHDYEETTTMYLLDNCCYLYARDALSPLTEELDRPTGHLVNRTTVEYMY